MPQFRINSKNIENNHVKIIEKDLIKHMVNVLRLDKNDELLLIDEYGIVYTTRVTEADKSHVKAEILHAQKSTRKLNFQLDLLQCTLKSSAMDMVVQKVTELGAKNLFVMPSARSIPHFNDKESDNKLEKWRKIMSESCKQCERADIPNVFYINNLNNLKEHAKQYDLVVACVERSSEKTLKDALQLVKNPQKVLIIVGPEGGFESSEVEFFKENNYATVSISNLIYRAETAAIAALAGVIYEYEL